MSSFFKIFAYICIWTTPFQIAFILWCIGIVTATDYNIISLTTIELIKSYLSFLIPLVNVAYTWFSNPLLDWVFSLPIILHTSFKAVASTWLGFWILKKIR